MTGAAYLMGAARIPDFSRNHGAAPARGLAEPNPRMEKCTVTVADRFVEHLERSGFVVMRRPPTIGGAAIGREQRDR
jgi:hypothetical protein